MCIISAYLMDFYNLFHENKSFLCIMCCSFVNKIFHFFHYLDKSIAYSNVLIICKLYKYMNKEKWNMIIKIKFFNIVLI